MIRLTSGGMSAALLRHRHFEEDLDGGVEQGVHEALRGQAPLDQLFDDDQQPALNSDRRRNYGHTHTHTRTHTHTQYTYLQRRKIHSSDSLQTSSWHGVGVGGRSNELETLLLVVRYPRFEQNGIDSELRVQQRHVAVDLRANSIRSKRWWHASLRHHRT